ncbi:biofilm PGA synthesis protein PgaC [bacterium]|nr:biofilm PGA synthesis protein PgaC [bacterium]NDA10514.1 biofilm PGA synthesis protein PgaC [Verrucomicrobiota bacterium]NDA26643.1 biofilm PGA synthesis protein PgaC [Verrucomicrobiota bacterium]NDD82243.1 biofilm PGA synthesis protein PgaC [Verrucomicrobiota bacterium]
MRFILWLGMLVVSSLGCSAEPMRIGVYSHSTNETKAAGIVRVFTLILTKKKGYDVQRVKPEDIRNGVLTNLDVLIMPGGSGSKQATNLETTGREAIQQFVKHGGGYVGICAGAYLASSHYPWSLHIINAQVIDRQHWARGKGNVILTFSELGQKALGHPEKEVEVYYGQGPLYGRGTNDALPPYEELAVYKTEVAKENVPEGVPMGVMPGTTAIARTEYGKGRVICYSPHPEKPFQPVYHLIENGVRWAAGKEPIPVSEAEWQQRPKPGKPEPPEPEE